MAAVYEFERWRLRIDARWVEVDGRAATLGPRALQLLRVLAENADQPVAKHRLLEEVWQDLVVEEGNLPVQVSSLRKVLGADAIMTVPGRGYQLVTRAPGSAKSPAADRHAPGGQRAVARTDLPARERSSVPPALLPLIGREQELGKLVELLESATLVSVVGAGGVGKTRLATAAARAFEERFPGKIWWCDLADVQHPDGVVERVAGVLGTSLAGAENRVQTVARALVAAQASLLVLDNCEHLLKAVISLVEGLREAQPRLTVLVTSQAPLRVPHEMQFRLGSLLIPQPEGDMADALRTGALGLLVARAHAADSRFELHPSTLEAAIQICRALDGNALAIEMAASRLPWMGVHGVATRLQERFRMLSLESRAAAPRHRSLQTMLEWSHSLLAPVEQLVFRRLAAFAATFSLEEVPGVVCDESLDEWEAIDALGVLVERSLVHVAHDKAFEGRLRYRILEIPRFFAREQLRSVGELDAVLVRHVAAFSRRCDELNERFWREPEIAWLATVRPDLPNLHLALNTALDRGEATQVTELFEALTNAERLAPGGRETWSWNERIALVAQQTGGELRARLFLAMGTALRNVRPVQAAEMGAQGLQSLGDMGDTRIRYLLHVMRATGLALGGQPTQAAVDADEAQALMDDRWPPKLKAICGFALGLAAAMVGDAQRAQDEFRRTREMAIAADAQAMVVSASLNLAEIHLELGQPAAAIILSDELVSSLRDQASTFHFGLALCLACKARMQAGDYAAARASGIEALSYLRQDGLAVWLYEHFALLSHRLGDHASAARLIGYCDTARARSGRAPTPSDIKVRDEVCNGVGAKIGDGVRDLLLQEGAVLDMDQAEELALKAAGAA
jgi:predicted ATPase/DNA-binding winged helix-turn-helix (wHTH) protein